MSQNLFGNGLGVALSDLSLVTRFSLLGVAGFLLGGVLWCRGRISKLISIWWPQWQLSARILYMSGTFLVP